MDGFDNFNDAQLLAKREFYSVLNDEHASDEDYEHARRVCEAFGLESMGDYHNLYLVSDVLFAF